MTGICKFCKKECEGQPTSVWYYCADCDTSFYENDLNYGNSAMVFFKNIRDRRYRLEVLTNKTKFFLFQLEPTFELLHAAREQMHVTPETAVDKIKYLLTFL